MAAEAGLCASFPSPDLGAAGAVTQLCSPQGPELHPLLGLPKGPLCLSCPFVAGSGFCTKSAQARDMVWNPRPR